MPAGSARPGSTPRTMRQTALPFREERSRAKRKVLLGAGVAGLFVACLIQVWLTTHVAEATGRVNRMAQSVELTEIDLAIARAELSQRQVFSELSASAEKAGFRRDGRIEEVALGGETPQRSPVIEQLAEDLVRGSFRLMSEARAQDLRPEESWDRAAGR